MITVDTIGRVRRAHFVQKKSIKAIARELRLARNTVRSIIRAEAETERRYERRAQPMPQLGPYIAALEAMLAANARRPKRERLTCQRMLEELRLEGYRGSYDNVRRYARSWAEREGERTEEAYVPLSFAPGEAYQFDWSHECVVIGGVTTMVKVAQVRLCHSRMLFVRAYPRESQEMVFDAHEKAFQLFKGVPRRGIYDNMKTAVDAVLVGKGRAFNRRFQQLMSHHLIEPTACTPAAGWEKGQVENQVGFVRKRLFSPRLKFKSYEELNAWLAERCIVLAQTHPHPVEKERSVFEVFEAERPLLMPYRGAFDGFHAVSASVSKTCLVTLRQQQVLGRRFGCRSSCRCACLCRSHRHQAGRPHRRRAQAPLRSPSGGLRSLALRAGSGEKARRLEERRAVQGLAAAGAIEKVRRKLAGSHDGDRQMVKILTAVLTDGLTAVEAACAESLAAGIAGADVILNALARHSDHRCGGADRSAGAPHPRRAARCRLRPLRCIAVSGFHGGLPWSALKSST